MKRIRETFFLEPQTSNSTSSFSVLGYVLAWINGFTVVATLVELLLLHYIFPHLLSHFLPQVSLTPPLDGPSHDFVYVATSHHDRACDGQCSFRIIGLDKLEEFVLWQYFYLMG